MTPNLGNHARIVLLQRVSQRGRGLQLGRRLRHGEVEGPDVVPVEIDGSAVIYGPQVVGMPGRVAYPLEADRLNIRDVDNDS